MVKSDGQQDLLLLHTYGISWHVQIERRWHCLVRGSKRQVKEHIPGEKMFSFGYLLKGFFCISTFHDNFLCIAFNKTNTIANMIIIFIAKRFDASRWGGGSDGHLYDFAKRCQFHITAKWKLHTLCLSDTSILAKLGWCNVYIGWEALVEKYLRMDTFPRTSLSDV